MAGDTAATTFITGADGFVGRALVKILVARGHQVFGLTQTAEAAETIVVPARSPSWAICSKRVNGRTGRQLTGSSIFRRIRSVNCA